MVGSLRVIGILIIIITVIGIVVGAVVAWKVVVADKREAMRIYKDMYEDSLDGEMFGRPVIKDESILYFEKKWDAEQEYEKAVRLFYVYFCAMVVGSVFPVASGLFLLAVAEIVLHLRNVDGTEKGK